MDKPKTDRARRAAVAALVRQHRGGWSNLSIAAALGVAGPLDGRDRAFAGALFFGTAERLTTLDWLLQPLLKRPLDRMDAEVRAILETGLYQMLWMRVPASAAVNESVKLARSFGKSSAAGLVNAVLRRAAPGAGADGPPNFSAMTFDSELERVMVTWAVGEAVARAVMEALPGEYDAFFEHSFSDGVLCLRVNTLKTDREALAQALQGQGADTRPGFLPGMLYAVLPGGVAGNPQFDAGLFQVQGAASQVACACLDARPGQRVLDLCAAPGGKSATLAQMLGGGAGLTACELRENRLPLIGETLERLGIGGARVLQNDGTIFREDLQGQDCVLCDVPCSGLGTLATKPDLRLADGAGFDALPPLQLKLLSTAARYVSMGGRLVYSTCTVRPQENAGVVRAFLAENPGYRPVEPAFVPEGAVVEEQMMTLLPHRAGTDGFFVATLERMW